MEISREAITSTARKFLGTRFRHQGRDAVTGIDCVGLAALVASELGYEYEDVDAYRRVPSANVIREMMVKNCDEIPLDEVRSGDLYLMRIGGRKPRHVAIRISDDTDLSKGIEPMLIHAKSTNNCVVIEPVRQWAKDFVAGYRMRGVTG